MPTSHSVRQITMQAFYNDVFELPLPRRNRFPMAKYRRLRDQVVALSAEHGIDVAPAPAATDEQLALVHAQPYLRRALTGSLSALEMRRIGFPWSSQLIERSRRSVGATLAAARHALADGAAANLAGGTHHASADRGQGYCVFNDVAVAIRVLQSEQLIRKAVILDCDVHQGNGTAAIFHGDDDVFTFSVHGDRNFPFSKVPSDLDIALPDGAPDDLYLARLYDALDHRVPLAGMDIVFYVAGADPYEHDRLGRLKMSTSGLAQRDRLVLSICGQFGLPVTVVMGGGYAADIQQIVAIHAQTIVVASEFTWQRRSQAACSAVSSPHQLEGRHPKPTASNVAGGRRLGPPTAGSFTMPAKQMKAAD